MEHCPICGERLELEDAIPARHGPAHFIILCPNGHKIVEEWELKEDGTMEFLGYEIEEEEV